MSIVSGKVKIYNLEKGYGFIKVDGTDNEVFFHVSGLVKGWDAMIEPPVKDQVVFFQVVSGERGDKAINVSREEPSVE